MTEKKIRVLLAGVGNVLRGDDGFGPAALSALKERLERGGGLEASGLDLELFETGIAGIALVQKLMDGYDGLVILDALDRGAPPGQVFVLEPDRERMSTDPPVRVDPHLANPEGVVRLAFSLGVLPPKAWIVGCQAGSCDELEAELSSAAAGAVPRVVERVLAILAGLEPSIGRRASVGTTGDSSIAAVDEMLQVMYWLAGEGLAPEATPARVARLVTLDEAAIAALFERMARSGLVEACGEPGCYRLTEVGAREGGRRFAEEFRDLTKPGHGECGDPECDCHESGDPADCRLA